MKADERRRMENQLMVMGLNRLTDPELVPQMAKLITSHEFFLGMLNECDQAKRTEMYEALRPHLSFKPWPLERYIMKLKEHADAVESHGRPIQVGDQTFVETPMERATACLVDLTCCKCTRTATFPGNTAVEAILAAREAGWVRDVALQKEICPRCPAIRDQKVGHA